jgi:hypothetical protein
VESQDLQQQLTDDMQNEMSENLINSEMTSVMVDDDNSLENTSENTEVQNPINTNPTQINPKHCCLDQWGRCVPCP